MSNFLVDHDFAGVVDSTCTDLDFAGVVVLVNQEWIVRSGFLLTLNNYASFARLVSNVRFVIIRHHSSTAW